MAALLALASAAVYGAGDFLGGIAARRLPPVAVALRSNVVGLLGLLAALPLAGDVALAGRHVAFGCLGGLAGGTGVVLLYRGLARGVMSVVAPVTAVLSAVVPVGFGIVGGDRPSPLALAGVPLALLAIVLLAREPRDEDARTHGMARADLALALGAGLGFGLFFVCLDAAGEETGLWPLIASRVTSVTLLSCVAAAWSGARAGRGAALVGSLPAAILGCGILDAAGNTLFLLATQEGMLSLVAVLAALYPASTLLLARAVLGERLGRGQQGGVALATAAIVLVTAG